MIKDDIRKDIDELNARLDALTDNLESLNTSIKSFKRLCRELFLSLNILWMRKAIIP